MAIPSASQDVDVLPGDGGKKKKKHRADVESQVADIEVGDGANKKGKKRKKLEEMDEDVHSSKRKSKRNKPVKIDWASRRLEKKKKKQERTTQLDEKTKMAIDEKQQKKCSRENYNKTVIKKGGLTKKQKYLIAKAAKKAQVQSGKKSTPQSSFNIEKALVTAKLDSVNPKALSCFLTGLPYMATEKHVSEHFAKIGPCTVQLLNDKVNGRSNGTGFVNFTSAKHALEAVTYTGSKIQGRWIKIRLCEPRDTVVERKDGPGEKPNGCLGAVVKCDKSISEASLKRFFSECWVANMSRLLDKETGEFTGTAFLDFDDTHMVDKAVEMNGRSFKGFPIYVRYKKDKNVNPSGRVAPQNRAPPVPPPSNKVITFDESDDE